MSRLHCVAIYTLCCLAVPLFVNSQASRRFSVRDDIEMVRFEDPPGGGGRGTVKFSPDYQYFAVVTERGILEGNVVEDSLWMFRTSDIVKRLRSSTSSDITVHPLVRMTARHFPVIYDLEWVDSSSVTFRARTGHHKLQLFKVNARTGSLDAVSGRGQDVGMYGQFDTRNGNSIYTVISPAVRHQLDEESMSRVVQVVSGSLADVLHLPEPDGSTSHEGDIDWRDLWAVIGGKQRKIETNAFQSPLHISPGILPHKIGLSPDGRSVVIPLPVSYIPEQWSRYAVNLGQPFVSRIQPGAQDLNVKDTSFLAYQFMLINLAKGTMKPLLNAPVGSSGGYHRPRPFATWSSDGRQIALVNTYLPLDSEKSARTPCIAVLNVVTGNAVCLETVAEDSEQREERFTAITDLHFDPSDCTRLIWSYEDSSKDIGGTLIYRLKKDGKWNRVKETAPTGAPINVTIQQSLNDPPKIVATDRETGFSIIVLDPNPQLRTMSLGEVSEFHWTDNVGRHWEGGLVKPPDYIPGRRYPLVIQTHGFIKDDFLVNGGLTTAFAARELAAVGIVVLQVNDQRCTLHFMGSTEEDQCAVRAYESGVRRLVDDGMVDPEKVGITGFSQTGLYTMRALTDGKIHLAAATISDATVGGYLEFVYGIGDPRGPDLLKNDIGRIGVAPVGEGLNTWIARSPVFNISRISTPIRFEAVSPTVTSFMWEPFALLQYLRKPAEFVQIDFGTHPLSNPEERLASQGGAVDWFRFWLQDYEDPDPAKADQYIRWRELRTLQQANDKKAADDSAPTPPKRDH